MPRPVKYDHEKILKLLDLGRTPGEIAEFLCMKTSSVYEAIRTVKKNAGMIPAKRASTPPRAARPAPISDRPGVMVITVPTAKLDGDGLPRRMPVSLTRLSILDGWTGVA